MSKVEQLKKFLLTYESDGENNSINIGNGSLCSASNIGGIKFLDLETLSPALLGMDMFKGVNKIHMIPTPTYVKQKGTNVPAECFPKEKRKEDGVGQVVNISLDEDVGFNEEIYVYSLNLSQGVETIGKSEDFLKEQGEGIYLSSTVHNVNTFEPEKRLTVVFDEAKMKEFGDQYIKTVLTEAIDVVKKGESNLPRERRLVLRCSSDSIKLN